jgi:hypothetical protein
MQRVVIQASDLSHVRDDDFCPEASEFSGFREDEEASPRAVVSSPSPLVFVAERGI